MILRRVIAHMCKQEWTATWIDLVDQGTIDATAAALRAEPSVLASHRYQCSYSAHAKIRGDVVVLDRALTALDVLPMPAESAP